MLYLSSTQTPAACSVNAGPCLLAKLPTLSLSVHVGQTERHWKTEIWSPLLYLVQPVMQVCVCVCGNAWVYSPFKPELTRSWVAAAEGVSTDKRIWVSTILLFDSDITMSFSEPRQQGAVGGGIRGSWENKTGVVDCQSGARGRWRLITERRLEQQQKNARLHCRWKQEWIREHIVLQGCCYL